MIKIIHNKIKYSDFLKKCERYNFLQSWEWGEFQESLGNKVYRFGYLKNKKLVGVTTLFIEKTKLCKIGIIQGGPVFKELNKSDLQNFLLDILIKTKGEFDLFRVAPYIKEDESFGEAFTGLKFKPTTGKVIANHTSELDLTKSEDDLMKDMRKTTRYLVRQKEKFGIEITKSIDENDVRLYCDIEKDTVIKHKFNPYPFKRVLNEVKTFSPDNTLIFKATYKEKVISMAIVMFYGDEADYLYGASLSEFNSIPASYVIQWEAIKEAKQRGYKKYNFWGVSDQFIKKGGKQITHPWWGLSQFKRGFGGEDVKYLPGFDLVRSPKGHAQRLLEMYRKIKR